MSLHLTTRHRLLQHAAAFALAWVAASLLFAYLLRSIQPDLPQPGYHIETLGKGETAVHNLLYLSGALRGGKTIVVFGSSELNPRHSREFTPQLFFPDHHLARVLTYGRAGFDTLGMYGLLYALKPHLNQGTRLVILLSPEWFRTNDLPTQAFVANFNDNVLLQIYWSDDPREVFHDYLVAHQAEFTEMSSTQRMFMRDPSSILDMDFPDFLLETINVRAYSQREKFNLRLAQMQQQSAQQEFDAGNAMDLPWDTYMSDARRAEQRMMSNNDKWVRNGFYDLHLRGSPFKYKDYFPKNMNPEPEMTDLKLLLGLLDRSKVHALFVMQPLNPQLYDDLARFNAVDARVASLCNEYHMKYLDMYAETYDPGILRDNIHLGELGWEQVDSEIAEYFRL